MSDQEPNAKFPYFQIIVLRSLQIRSQCTSSDTDTAVVFASGQNCMSLVTTKSSEQLTYMYPESS